MAVFSLLPRRAWCRKVRSTCQSVPPVTVKGVTLMGRPNPYVSNTTAWVDEGTSSYHSLNVSLMKRVARGLSFKANYSRK